MLVGYSTGAVAFQDFDKALRLLEDTQANAVELSALRIAELEPLLSALPSKLEQLRKRYNYISFHAPTKFDDEAALVKRLTTVADLGLNIIVHPDTIGIPTTWRVLGDRLCLENMDSRKPGGRTVSELREIFNALPQARLCFDIAHARQVDASMTEGFLILKAFRERLAQVHLSEVNSVGTHFPMSFAAKLAYEPFAAMLTEVPIIIESVVNEDQITTELEEAVKFANFRPSDALRRAS